MATQRAHRLAFTAKLAERDAQHAAAGIGARLFTWMKQSYCGLHGHDALMQFEKDRVFLQCTSCGHETPGWELTEAAPRLLLRGDMRRHRIPNPHFVDTRRIA